MKAVSLRPLFDQLTTTSADVVFYCQYYAVCATDFLIRWSKRLSATHVYGLIAVYFSITADFDNRNLNSKIDELVLQTQIIEEAPAHISNATLESHGTQTHNDKPYPILKDALENTLRSQSKLTQISTETKNDARANKDELQSSMQKIIRTIAKDELTTDEFKNLIDMLSGLDGNRFKFYGARDGATDLLKQKFYHTKSDSSIIYSLT